VVPSERELDWLRRVRDLCQRLASEREPKSLLNLILDSAIELTGAERGYLVEVTSREDDEEPHVKILCARGFARGALRGAVGDLSRTVVSRALEEKRALVTSSDQDRDVLQVSSVVFRKVLAIACAPMFLRGHPRGVLYLDHRFREKPFLEEDLPYLQTFADQGALALETAGLLADLDEARDKLGSSLRELEQLKARSSLAPDVQVARRVFGSLVGGCPPMLAVFEELERAVRTWEPVLLSGESGTGKAQVAREIHGRRGGSELQVAGSGDLDLQEGATLFVPELADLPPASQSLLIDRLRAGSDLRILSATSHSPESLLQDGKVRADLLYRLDVLRIMLPPLRQRGGDVHMLLEHFAERAGVVLRFTTHAKSLLEAYAWPGNLRQLENEVRRLIPHAPGPISAPQLSLEIAEGKGVAQAKGKAAGRTMAEVEEDMVAAALRASKGNKSRAARQLGIPRTTLYSLIQRYGL
jgi:serine/threonine-protein kinase PknK